MSVAIDGVAVKAPGNDASPGNVAGSIGNGDSLTGAIEYFIPLSDATNGIYGVGDLCGGSGAGTCSDTGYGSMYDTADGLVMNIFFDMTGLPEAGSASLAFQFDDLDLTPDNDPNGFFESISLSYWDWNGAGYDLTSLTPTIKSSVAPPPPSSDQPQQSADPNLVFWDLDLAAINALNESASANDGFWMQLGFGSLYEITPCPGTYSSYGSKSYASNGGYGGGAGGWYRYKKCKDPRNTPEYLTAELTVTAVPVPAAVWLFGTALIGFICISRRTRVS